jgi:hypothetical protein
VVESDYAGHCRGARAIAAEYIEASAWLARSWSAQGLA